jgi:hypothetical protein
MYRTVEPRRPRPSGPPKPCGPTQIHVNTIFRLDLVHTLKFERLQKMSAPRFVPSPAGSNSDDAEDDQPLFPGYEHPPEGKTVF